MPLVVKERQTGEVIASGNENEQVRAFEGNWYFQPDTVTMDHLRVTERTYTCPYKGVCYWVDLVDADQKVTQNIGWVYRQPKAGYEFIKDQFGFYARATEGTLSEKS
jgi:uncharacterized protein (DUF427 family)